MTKQNIIDALRAFLATRPGFDPANYGDRASYLSEMRQATRQRKEAERFLCDIELRDSITWQDIFDATRGGRIAIGYTSTCKVCQPDPTLQHKHDRRIVIEYTAGQYYPLEYRAAVARLASSVLWNWKRDNCMPTECCGLESAKLYPSKNGPVSGADWLRASFRREYGRGLAARYFT